MPLKVRKPSLRYLLRYCRSSQHLNTGQAKPIPHSLTSGHTIFCHALYFQKVYCGSDLTPVAYSEPNISYPGRMMPNTAELDPVCQGYEH